MANPLENGSLSRLPSFVDEFASDVDEFASDVSYVMICSSPTKHSPTHKGSKSIGKPKKPKKHKKPKDLGRSWNPPPSPLAAHPLAHISSNVCIFLVVWVFWVFRCFEYVRSYVPCSCPLGCHIRAPNLQTHGFGLGLAGLFFFWLLDT